MIKNTLYIFAILICFISSNSSAQTGWQWGKRSVIAHGGPTDVEANTVAVDGSGNIISAGLVDNGDTVSFGSTQILASEFIFITKLDPAGNFLWTIASGNSFGQVLSITTDKEDNIYLLGSMNRFSASTSDTFSMGPFFIIDTSVGSPMEYLVKISPAGVVHWLKKITITQNYVGLNGFELGKVAVDSNDNLHLVSSFSQATLTLGATTLINPEGFEPDDIFVAKLDTNGNFIWAKNVLSPTNLGVFSTTDAGGNTYVVCRPSSDSLIFGSTIMPIGAPHASIGGSVFKVSDAGAASFLFNLPPAALITDITTDVAGNIYPVGALTAPMVVGTYTLTPYSSVSAAYDMYVSKYNSSGTFIKAWIAGADSQQTALSVNIDRCGNILVGSSVRGQWGGGFSFPSYVVHFNSDSLVIPSPAGDLLILARFDTAGNYLSSTWLPSGGDDQWGMALDMNGNFYVGADYMEVQMIIGHDTLPAPTGYLDECFFVAKYRYDTVLCSLENELGTQQPTIHNPDQVAVFPNPASSECTISSRVPFTGNCNAQISDVTGRRHKTIQLQGNSTTFSVADLPAGVYLCLINFPDGSTVSRKILVMK